MHLVHAHQLDRRLLAGAAGLQQQARNHPGRRTARLGHPGVQRLDQCQRFALAQAGFLYAVHPLPRKGCSGRPSCRGLSARSSTIRLFD